MQASAIDGGQHQVVEVVDHASPPGAAAPVRAGSPAGRPSCRRPRRPRLRARGGVDHAPRPRALRRRSARTRGSTTATCFGWMHSLRAEAEAARAQRIGAQRSASSIAVLTPSTGAREVRRAAKPARAASGTAAARRLRPRCRGRAGNRSSRTPAAPRPGALRDRVAARRCRRADLDQRTAAARRRRRPRADRRARSAFGSITAADAGRRAQREVVVEPRRARRALMRTTTRARADASQRRNASRAALLRVGRDGVLQVDDHRVGARGAAPCRSARAGRPGTNRKVRAAVGMAATLPQLKKRRHARRAIGERGQIAARSRAAHLGLARRRR